MSEDVMEEPAQQDPWLRPYVEHRILAGFLGTEDVLKVQPYSANWPEDIATRVRTLHGAVRNLPTRPQAGQCRLFPVEEPDVLDVLQVASQTLLIEPNVPVSYSWVEISNLIAAVSIADALPQETVVFNKNPKSLAEYSFYGPPPVLKVANGVLYSSSPLNVEGLPLGLHNNQLIIRCQLSLPPRPILVGYEQERFYLLNAYGRVLQAIIGKVEKLLCMVHYGLDFSDPQMGIRLPMNGAVNHFGHALLSSDRPPLVKDFLDPSLSAVIPARAPLFMVIPSIQANQALFMTPPSAQLPLNIVVDGKAGT